MEKAINKRSVGDYLLASKQCDILDLEHLLQMGQLVVSISNLVHALQRERGTSNMFVASGGQRGFDSLSEMVESAKHAERRFRVRLGDIDIDTGCMPGGSRLFSRIAYAVHGLDELNEVRGQIREQRLTPEAIIDGYSKLIAGLLAVVFEAADSAADPDISRLLVTMFHLMQGKELAGQERAVGATGFAQGNFSERLNEQLRHLIDNQERCFQVFADFADPNALAVWEETHSSECSAVIERLRRIAFSSTTQADSELSEIWFARTTERIDAYKRVEDQLEASLDALCERKIAEAKADLDSHQMHIDALSEQPPGSGAFAIFYSGVPVSPSEAPVAEAYNAGVTSPQLGRSLIELVQSQSLRLQTMSEELQEAREALTERKTIDQAKGLIMKHRRINEDEAYRFLRNVAMAQRRKLADVAADTITMADILRDPE